MFYKYFTLDEAVELLPFVSGVFKQAHTELAEIRDDILLYKRIYQIQEEEGIRTLQPSALVELLQYKWHSYEECFYQWVNLLTKKGIQIRDFKKGLVDFPYKAKDGQEYFLCWHLGEERLFYFHNANEGFDRRKPITLLPN